MLRLADAADTLTSDAWLSGDLVVATKTDDSPVTATDVAVEVALRDLVLRRFPNDSFLGEEVGLAEGSSGRQWVVDGIDGTTAFVTGRPEWSTLISLVIDGQPVAGLASSPALGRRWSGTLADGAQVVALGAQPRRLQVSDQALVDDARIGSWPPPASAMSEYRSSAERFARLNVPPAQRPSWDTEVPNGAMLVAEGRLDAFVLFGGGAWDHAACSAIVVAAGGRWSDLNGNERVQGGAGVYSNSHLHDELLASLRSSD